VLDLDHIAWGKKRTPKPPERACPHCGGTHAGLPTDYGGRLPERTTSPIHNAERGNWRDGTR
jgi:hypothetical protein